MEKTMFLVLIFVLASFLVSFYFYPLMPDMMASHWNINNVADGYMQKAVVLFLMPFVTEGMPTCR